MSPEELEALNYKYPTCSTCQSRGVRTHKVGKRKTAETTWCELHNRPVEYEYFTGPKGQKWVATDVPCDQRPRGDYCSHRESSLPKDTIVVKLDRIEKDHII
jgi:hypothetical protein